MKQRPLRPPAYAELSVRFATFEAVDALLDDIGVKPTAMPRPALFPAGKVFRTYRAAGGQRTGVLPDVFIGAHAAVMELALVSRDARRYRHHVPTLHRIAP
jgi:predicted nucleic acid-binding protein